MALHILPNYAGFAALAQSPGAPQITAVHPPAPPSACSLASATDERPSSSGSGPSRRAALAWPAGVLASVATAAPAGASQLPEAADQAWEAMGGGPADLVYPDNFLGTWDVESVLSTVQLPFGPELVPDMEVVRRAQTMDQGRVVRYQVAFVRNGRGQVVTDRRYNTASLMHTYLGLETADVARRIAWNLDNPNVLEMGLPGGLQVSTRVTRRSEEFWAAQDRLATSEFFQQLIETPERPRPKVKASQAFTKYHWRPAEAVAVAEGGPAIVATQVVSDFASGEDAMAMMKANGRPITMYTYRMAFRRPPTGSA